MYWAGSEWHHRSGCEDSKLGYSNETILAKRKFDQEMPQSQTNPRHREEETQNNNNHICLFDSLCPINNLSVI